MVHVLEFHGMFAFLYLTLYLWLYTKLASSGISYLSTYNSSISVIPRVITNCAPDSIQTHFHTTFTHSITWSTNEPYVP